MEGGICEVKRNNLIAIAICITAIIYISVTLLGTERIFEAVSMIGR